MEDFNILFEMDGFCYINCALLKYYLSWLLGFGIPLNFISKATPHSNPGPVCSLGSVLLSWLLEIFDLFTLEQLFPNVGL